MLKSRLSSTLLQFLIPRYLPAKPFSMDVVISTTADKIKVLAHQQYHTPDHISPATVQPAPIEQFRKWLKEAVESGVLEPEVMSLSTATPSGLPSARIVLLKQVDPRGFVFFTNYTSRKSREILSNPHAALVFYWREMHRSVRVVGKVEKVTREESDEYFQTRPVGSRLGAWASKQSTVIGEQVVEDRLKQVQEKFGVKEGDEDGNVPTPEFWGGWRVVPR